MPRTSVLDLQRMKAGNQRIAMITAYDATTARLVDEAGVDIVLVGDSLGMVVQGREDTLAVTMDDMIYHGRCVARGLGAAAGGEGAAARRTAHLSVDMPFMSYQISPAQALANAGRLVQEGGAQSVKLEGGARSAEAIRLIVEAGIPVMGHLGLTPQSIHALGGFKVQGRSDAESDRLVEDAKLLEEAGVFSIVLEMIPAEVAKDVTAAVRVPTIGIGAGPHCDGQVLVSNDLWGLDASFQPRFVKRYAELENPMVTAVARYVADVREGKFPGPEHSFHRARGDAKVARLY
jgi:3-methyl-2-oxobutanoate hydroxymethyltransferase